MRTFSLLYYFTLSQISTLYLLTLNFLMAGRQWTMKMVKEDVQIVQDSQRVTAGLSSPLRDLSTCGRGRTWWTN